MEVVRGPQSVEESEEGLVSQQKRDGSGFHEDQEERDRALFDKLIQAFESELDDRAEGN